MVPQCFFIFRGQKKKNRKNFTAIIHKFKYVFFGNGSLSLFPLEKCFCRNAGGSGCGSTCLVFLGQNSTGKIVSICVPLNKEAQASTGIVAVAGFSAIPLCSKLMLLSMIKMF